MHIELIKDTKYGDFLVNTKDDFVGRSLISYGQYCETEVAFLSNIISEDSIVVDVGANIGALTIPLAKIAKRVFAFEPHPRLYNVLCGNIALNNLTNVEAYKVAIGEKDEVKYCQDIEKFERNNGAHSLVSDGAAEFAVHVTSSVPACNLLKVDVEGMELEVLKGAKQMIDVCAPFLWIENDRQEKSDALIEYLIDELHYKCWWCAWCLYDENNHFKNTDNCFGDMGCINMICVPDGTDVDFSQFGLKRVVKGGWYKDEPSLIILP